MRTPSRTAIALLFSCVFAAMAFGQKVVELPADSPSLVVREALAIESLARGGRSLIVTDPVEASIVRGEWAAPAEGDTVSTPDGREATWEAIAANDDGVFGGRAAAGYVHVIVRSEAERIMMLHARGHRHVMINGERRGGDVYNLGITALPIELRAGDNELLFRGGRGQVRIELKEPEAELFWLGSDVTKPDIVEGHGGPFWLAAPLVNATSEQRLGVTGRLVGERSADGSQSGLGAITPLGVRKLPVGIALAAPTEDKEAEIGFRASDGGTIATSSATLRVVSPGDKHSRTFISDIDGSVQYYAVTPPSTGASPEALILTLHGASVEARNQAFAYDHKDWAVVVAPTNRRPFGFDWEDWGRIDAIEVLEEASERFGQPNKERTYLTGHSMGGHGTWQVGAHFAPRFAAIGPSAGWRDFWSYGGAGQFEEADAVGGILNTANNASRTLLLQENYTDLGVYVLHGDADDNVPVSQARFMREQLAEFHPDFAYYEQPGAGHWWGNRCVDWPQMMRFFEDRSNEMAPATESFTTINPAISSEARLFTIHRQAKAMLPTRIEVQKNTADNALEFATDNVLAFGADLLDTDGLDPSKPIHAIVDGESFEHVFDPRADNGPLRFERSSLDEAWRIAIQFDPALKGAHRGGPFKHAFDNHMVFVYATGGTDEENAWALAKARYDADTWQYRANGSVDVVPDTAFDLDDAQNAARNVIVYGCADSHRLWDALLGDAPVRVGRGRVAVGDRVLERDDLAAHFVYPRSGSETALVGVVAGSGDVGRRLADEARYFISGVGYPDWLITSPAMLEEGLEGVIGAGFFGVDWSVDQSQSAWRN